MILMSQVRDGPRLHAVIQGVLTVGNAVNIGTAYGNAQGIKLDSLLKLADVKVSQMLLSHGNVCRQMVNWHKHFRLSAFRCCTRVATMMLDDP